MASVEYSKERQTGRVMAGTKEAKDLMKRAFGGKKEFKPKKPDSLLVKAQKVFNAFIRKRDEGKPCINCGHPRTLQAGHFYPTSTHSHLRFDEDNVHGECKQCNYFNSQSHAYKYRVNLERKIGKERFEDLEKRAALRVTIHNARFIYEEIIEKYK